jgi:hypothetical protein
MWLLKGRMSWGMPEALAHANLWEAKARNLVGPACDFDFFLEKSGKIQKIRDSR